MLPLICAWISGWVNHRDTGNLRRHRAHNDVTVIFDVNRQYVTQQVSDAVWLSNNIKSEVNGPFWYSKAIISFCSITRLPLVLTHWGRDEMAAIFPTMFSNAISRMKINGFWFKFQWCIFPRVQTTIFQHLFAPSNYLNQWWLVYWRIYASLGLNELI